ncbi:MAG TPA: cupin domain-containing protein [Pyrinomonadaceae bacterium]|nr:cupin domain-containing protein [Pyrinomonadaceae bacterium]
MSIDESGASMDRSRVIHLAEAEAAIPRALGEHAIGLFQRGTLSVKLSQPVPPNRQTPHEQDELYVVVRGRGVLVHDGKRDSFETGDLMFIAAGTEHHVEDFTDDLTVWVVFYGQQGGEVPAQ